MRKNGNNSTLSQKISDARAYALLLYIYGKKGDRTEYIRLKYIRLKYIGQNILGQNIYRAKYIPDKIY